VSLSDLPDDLRGWHARGKTVTINDQTMFYLVEGGDVTSKSVIVLIHGFPTSSVDYMRSMATLAKNTGKTVVAFDHVGFGFSSKPKVCAFVLNSNSYC
jgi:pimeloyl-ACP methyl ester carboxylesterase